MKSKHTDEQLNWLRSRLPEYENRAAAQVRGDAKGFALKCAEEYIEKWGLGTGPDAEKESQVKERIYTWFKNTSARGKEARRKHAATKNDRDSTGLTTSPGIASSSYQFIGDGGDDSVKKPDILPFPESRHQHPLVGGMPVTPPHGVMAPPPQPSPIMVQYAGVPPTGLPMVPVASGSTHHPQLTQAFLQPSLSPQNLAQIVHSSSANQVYHSGLGSAIQSLLYAATQLNIQNSDNPGGAVDAIIELARRYKNMLPHLPMSLSHFGCTGPQAGIKALRVALRKNSTWIAYSSTATVSPPSPSSASTTSTPRRSEVPIHDQMHRTSIDRIRKKEYFIWAMIHSAAYEVGLLGPSKNPAELGLSPEQRDDDDGSLKLAESIAKDGLWETEESDWVAGALLLRAVVRRYVEEHVMAGAVAPQKREWEELLSAYEARWKEVKDESRQQAMEDALNTGRKTLEALH